MLSILLYTSTTIFIVYIILELTWRIWTRRYSFLPSAPNIPWLGTIPYFGSNSREIYKKLTSFYIKYDHLYVAWYSIKPEICIGCVEWIEPLLKSQDILKKSWFYRFASVWLGNGLVISTGEMWKKRRTALTGAFHFAILNDFIDIYEKYAQILVNTFETLASNGNVVEVQSPISLATLDVICETSMGVKMNALESGESDYLNAIQGVKIGIINRAYNPLVWSNFVYRLTSVGKTFYQNLNIVHNFTIDVINKNIALRNNDKEKINMKDVNQPYIKRKRVFLDTLLDLYDNGEIDLDGIREEVDTFMFGGHDTSATVLSWALYEIGRHPDIQQKIHDEINSISSNQCSLMDKIRQLKYLKSVIKESLRMHPPIPGVCRELEKDMIIGKNIIPSGTTMCVQIRSVHMNSKYWDEPSVFNPDRFLSENLLKRNPYCYIPFSAGPRNCIGQTFAMLELKVFLYIILSKYKIKSMQAPGELEICSELITFSANGINIEFSSRNM